MEVESKPTGNWFAPRPVATGAVMEAMKLLKPLCKGSPRRLGERAGRNGSERCTGPETGDAEADPPRFEGRRMTMDDHERTSSIGSAGVLATACRQSGSDATREAPAVIDKSVTCER